MHQFTAHLWMRWREVDGQEGGGRMRYESDVERRLTACVERAGGVCVKHGQDGWPDRVVVLPGGVLVWVELKRQGGRIAPLQELRIRRLRELGQRVELVWSAQEAEALVERLSRTTATHESSV